MKNFKGSVNDFLNLVNFYDKSVNVPICENYPYKNIEGSFSEKEKVSISKIIDSAVRKFNSSEIKY